MPESHNPRTRINAIMQTLTQDGYVPGSEVTYGILRAAIIASTACYKDKTISSVIKLLEDMDKIRQTGIVGVWKRA